MEGVQIAMTTRYLEPHMGGMEFGLRNTATAVIKRDRYIEKISFMLSNSDMQCLLN
jgi:hypothetical protein